MKRGPAGSIAHAFIDSPLTPLVIVAAMLLGAFSIWQTPREEEPQIVVPMLDVFVNMPGAAAAEVEQRVTIPMERLLQEIPGVEYLYSTSQPGGALVIVRFYVGIKEEDAIVRTYNKLYANFDRIPQGASQPLIKARSIDDVPVLAMTFWGKNYDSAAVRRVAAEVQQSVKQVENVSETTLLGGQKRELKVMLDPQKLAAFHLGPLLVARVLETSNQRTQAGSFAEGNQELAVEAGNFLKSADEARKIVVAVQSGRPIYLGDVANVADGPEDPVNYVYFGTGRAEAGIAGTYPAVTLAVAKRKGANATNVSQEVLAKVDSLRGYVLPSDLQVTITRNYGQTAKHKSDELLKHLFLATISVTLLVGLALGWRESGVVLLAIPVTLALTLFIFYAYGYTLNRVTLFALIFSIGILVDDAIVVVENIVRHFRLPENQGRSWSDVAVEAVDEVGNPTILATFAVIAAILPMAFVRGLMGPYMRPIPVGASAAMLFSLMVAFVVSPWAALRLLRGQTGKYAEGEAEGRTTKFYRRLMTGFVRYPGKRWTFLATVVVLFLMACSLVVFKAVRVKMLPFDNKSEFQVIVDMPEGTPLERTLAVEQEIGAYLHTQAEVLNYQIYAGTSGPYNFNGLVRHYYLRRGVNQGDIQVNLRSVEERKRQSHEIAKEIRGPVQEIARKWNARVKVAEVPPGPPVVATLVAEVYGPDYPRQIEVARQIRKIFDEMPGVVDVDWYVVADQKKLDFEVQQDKAALRGISTAEASQSVAMAVGGAQVGLMHQPSEREDVPIQVQLSRASRSSADALRGLYLNASDGAMVPLGELARVQEETIDKNIYRKNQREVVYVIADVAGAEESPVYAIGKLGEKINALQIPERYKIEQFTAIQPPDAKKLAVKWDGEWHITYEVFRDLGLAFAAVLVLIYVLVVGWFKSFKTPLVIMAPIPLTLVGILPAHAAMGAFFTATSMIGFIAGAGIIVRNSIILVDFIKLRREQGMPLEEAVVDAGAVRFRPMLLTAAAVVVGAGVILFDPIFQGLAISLMAGEVASTLLSRMAVPVLYYVSERNNRQLPPSVGESLRPTME
ncbi:MAG TPA: efflux RND transporter permease subunit [Candidatus Sulfotelmatobacter sp.]|nr:efflux RND transporter permease subunit [Candidatus Sulfotelmatobacter sp.]